MQDSTFMDAQAKVLDRYGIVAEDRWVAAPTVQGQAHVLVTGDGPPVVLMNGVGIPAGMLAPLMVESTGSPSTRWTCPPTG